METAKALALGKINTNNTQKNMVRTKAVVVRPTHVENSMPNVKNTDMYIRETRQKIPIRPQSDALMETWGDRKIKSSATSRLNTKGMVKLSIPPKYLAKSSLPRGVGFDNTSARVPL